jgi:hypothetical protein
VARTYGNLPEKRDSRQNYRTIGNRAGIEGFPPSYRLEPILDRANTPEERRTAAYASLQRTCPSTSSGESGNFISSRRLCRTRLHPTRFRFSPSPDEKFRAIVRRILGGEIENHFSSSHFQRLPSREHGRRHVGGLPQIPVSRHRIARFGVAGNHGQKVVVKVGRQTGPGPSSRIPRTVVNHRESGFR